MSLDLNKLYGMNRQDASDYIEQYGFTIADFPIAFPEPGNMQQFSKHSNWVAERLRDDPTLIGVWFRDGAISVVFGRYDPAEQAIV